MLTRRVTFRLYPSKLQTAKMLEARRLHAYLYNACVEHRKTSYKRFGKSISYFTQQAALVPFKEDWEEYKALNHGSLQATVKRVDYAFQRLFKGLAGYPSSNQSVNIRDGRILMHVRVLKYTQPE